MDQMIRSTFISQSPTEPAVDTLASSVYSQTAMYGNVNTLRTPVGSWMPKKASLLVVAILFVGCLSLTATVVRADAIDDEYLVQLRGLSDSNIDGHYKLAEWCRDKSRWDLVARQCRTVLRLNPGHRKAKLLLEYARGWLKKDQQPPPKGQAPSQTGVGSPLPRLLTDREIQKIRRAELFLDDREKARVRIEGRGTDRDFFDAMRTRSDFRYEKREFFRLPVQEKAAVMLKFGRDQWADKITVVTDPVRMKVFRREISPLIAANCATAECHGGAGGNKFQIYGDRRPSTNVAYTNFLVLHEYKVGLEEVINRITPEKSLLLTYSLPPDPAAPKLNHPAPITPPYVRTDDRDYIKLLNWVKSLDLDRPDYGIDISKPPSP
jgi:hypothetical protein